jgi:hypothetical protein
MSVKSGQPPVIGENLTEREMLEMARGQKRGAFLSGQTPQPPIFTPRGPRSGPGSNPGA